MGQDCLFRVEEIEEAGEQLPGSPVVHVVGINLQQSKKADEKKTSGGVSPRRMMEKIKAQGFRCFFSGDKVDRQDASIDHVVPLAKGGKHEVANLELVHAAVNRMKGTLTAEEFIAWCVKVAVHSGGCRLPERQDSQK